MPTDARKEIARYLAAFDFSGLFTSTSLGWDWPTTSSAKLRIPTGSGFTPLDVIAEKRGVKILHCPPDAKGRIPLSADRQKIQKAVAPLASEHLIIYTDASRTRQVWQWPAKRPGKPASLRELTWEKGKGNELLFQKLASIAFTLDEEDGLDITGVVLKLADALDRDRVTKRFYDLFKKQKDSFQKFIKGLNDSGLQAWYTSLMLNRIMFCYFLQRKGFLDGDQHYLSTRLARVQDQIGKNQFHSFYRSFLRRLFHEGLGSQERSQELTALIGSVPYLNGGIFDEHPIERDHPNLTIPDEAFEKVFKFFDQFDWHLDDRPIGNDKEINPEILGYVFEKYTNQKEMGAYYTKEDITEYISKNCIIPFLINAVADKIPASAWDLLKADPDHYIYPAVRHGAGSNVEEWEACLPKNIRRGLRPDTLSKTVTAERPIQTLDLRKDWNTTTPAPFNLPTEIWRETIARHQRCHELRDKLRSGSVTSIDDFVTLNLNIRQFAQDLIEAADASLLLALFKRLKKLSVLDPTCGSGAFLFAALEILEPLYTACIQRFRALLADWSSSGQKHPNWEKEIKTLLDHAAAHPNEGYYIHKTIIVHNLYGVDIMEEAVEICKLRLFLKLAAQLEPGQQVEPLPDIDFNIRSGNTLVGYATRDEVRRAFTEHQGGGQNSQLLLGGIEHSLDDYRRIEEQAMIADLAFKQFHAQQETTKLDATAFRHAKQELNDALKVMRDELDRFLASDYDKKHLKNDATFTKWRKSHQPFHWFIEFYGIIDQGGFDVIVGNPPYVEYSKVRVTYTLPKYQTLPSGNLYGLCMERANQIQSKHTWFGFIIQSPIVSTARMESVRGLYVDTSRLLAVSTFDDRPSKLFEGINHARVAIVIRCKGERTSGAQVTRYHKWSSVERPTLFQTMSYATTKVPRREDVLPKLRSLSEGLLYSKMHRLPLRLQTLLSTTPTNNKVFYKITGVGHWFTITHRAPKFVRDGQNTSSSRESLMNFSDVRTKQLVLCILNSTLFYWFYQMRTNCRDFNPSDFKSFPVPKFTKTEEFTALAVRLTKRLDKSTSRTSADHTLTGSIQFETFRPRECKPIIDEIDTVLAKHYGFTEEELDFIINYDIKYRLGLGRNGPADDEADED